jgi:hypothetical protein
MSRRNSGRKPESRCRFYPARAENAIGRRH